MNIVFLSSKLTYPQVRGTVQPLFLSFDSRENPDNQPVLDM